MIKTKAWKTIAGIRFKGRLGTFVNALAYLAGREATLLISGISFSFMVSLFPFIILLLTLSRHLRWEEFRESIFDAFHTFFPVSQDFIIRNLRIYTQNVGGLHLVSFLLLAWGVSAFFFSLEAGLDSAYRVPSYRKFIRSQLLGTLMAIGFGVGVFAFIALFRAVQTTSKPWLEPKGVGGLLVDQSSAVALSIAGTILIFFAIFRYLPNRRQSFRRVWPEATVSGLVWILGNLAFRYLLPVGHLKDIYGPFFISITLLFWAYGSACIILLFARLAADGFFQSGKGEGGIGNVGGRGSELREDDKRDHQPGGQDGQSQQ